MTTIGEVFYNRLCDLNLFLLKKRPNNPCCLILQAGLPSYRISYGTEFFINSAEEYILKYKNIFSTLHNIPTLDEMEVVYEKVKKLDFEKEIEEDAEDETVHHIKTMIDLCINIWSDLDDKEKIFYVKTIKLLILLCEKYNE